MFWYTFVKLCNEHGEKPNPVAKKLKISSGSVTNWKNGALPQSTTAKKIADYFGVSVDYLLENEGASRKAEILIPNADKTLTNHEQLVITAYREHPDMQPAVDKLLGIEQDDVVTLYAAAHSVDNRPDGIVHKSLEQWRKIEDAPDTDDPLV